MSIQTFVVVFVFVDHEYKVELNQKREIAFQSPAFGRIKKRWKMSGNIFSVSIIRTLDGVPKWLPHEVGKDEHWKLSLLMMSQLLLLLWMLRIMMLENLSLKDLCSTSTNLA